MADNWTNLKINKINRAMSIRVRLYHNSDSWNRVEDTTPRYFLKPMKLLSVERLGFSHKSRQKGYYKKGNRFYIGKFDTFLDNAGVEALYDQLLISYPYGYDKDDTASIKRYNLDVKYNRSFQSFYRKYWEDNLDKVQMRLFDTYSETYDKPYPCIEFDVLEPIINKHPVGDVPPKEIETTLWQAYSAGQDFYGDTTKYDVPCHKDEVNVYFNEDDDSFYLDGIRKGSIVLLSSGVQTPEEQQLDIHSGNGQYFYFDLRSPWASTTGTNSEYIQVPFRLSKTYGGATGLNKEFTTEISGELYNSITKFVTPTYTQMYIDVGEKDSSHPHYGLGSSKGFLVDTGSAYPHVGSGSIFLPSLDLIKGGEYYLYQMDTGNYNHSIYISTTPSGGGDYEKHQALELYLATSGESGSTIGMTSGMYPYLSGVELLNLAGSGIKFRPPLNAPNTLYYACANHAYMGGTINLTDPEPASGSLPGHTVAIYTDCGMTWDPTLSGLYHTGEYVNTGIFKPGKDIHYYTDYTGHAGGLIDFTDLCIGQGYLKAIGSDEI